MPTPGYHSTSQDLPARLREVLKRARKAPFYAARFADRSEDDLAAHWGEIPLTLKRDLIDHSPDGFRALPLEEVFHYHESFGTVDKPLSSWYTAEDFEHLPAIAGRWAAAFAPGKKILNRFPYAFPVPSPLVETIARVKGGVVIPAGNLNWNVSYARTLELIEKLRPEILCALPLEPLLLYELAKVLEISRERLNSISDICLSGGILSPRRIDYLEEIWKARVHNIYGSTEASGMASTCEKKALHLHSGEFLFEVLSPHTPHAPVADGEVGVLVVTTLFRKAMPLVRYFTRDLVRIDRAPCACGAPEKTLTVLGRLEDTLHHGGKDYYLNDLDQLLLDFSLKHGCGIFFVVVVNNGLLIRIETDHPKAFVTKDEVWRLERELGLSLHVELVPRDTLMHRPSMLKVPKVFKPQILSDWRYAKRKVSGLTEALIEWPRYSGRELMGLVGRSFRRSRLRKRLERLTF